MEGQSSKSEMYSARSNDHELYQCRTINLNIFNEKCQKFIKHKNTHKVIWLWTFIYFQNNCVIYIFFFQVLIIKIAKFWNVFVFCLVWLTQLFLSIIVLLHKSHKVFILQILGQVLICFSSIWMNGLQVSEIYFFFYFITQCL